MASLESMFRNQIPFATATALNDLAFQVQRAERANIQATFKSPRPFTVNSVVVDRATKTSHIAVVSIRPEVAKYLQPYETGGQHVLPGAVLLNPKDIALDRYGQLPKDIMAKLRGRQDIYIGTVDTRSGPVRGVWQRLQVTRAGRAKRATARGSAHHPTLGRLKLLIRFGGALTVNKHLGFVDRAADIVEANGVAAFGRAIDRALASAR